MNKMTKKLFLTYAPKFLREKFVRHNMNLNFSKSSIEGIILKIAETETELRQAFNLVYEEYKKRKVIGDCDIGLRITKYNMLPSTTIFIAVKDDEVIGTVSLILDTSIGLPADKITNLKQMRKSGHRIAEISALAVKQKYKKKTNFLFMSLTTLCNRFAHEIVGCRYIVAVVNKAYGYVYSDMFLFKDMKTSRKNSYHINDENAQAYVLNNRNYPENFKEVYNKKKDSQNLYKILVEPVWEKNIDIKESAFFLATKHAEKINNIIKILKENKEFFRNILNDIELQMVKQFYVSDNLLPNSGRNFFKSERDSTRVMTNMPLKIFNDQKKIIKGICYDVSAEGLCFLVEDELDESKELNLVIQLNKKFTVSIGAKIMWTNKNRVGVIVISNNLQWELWYQKILQDFQGFSESSQIKLVA